MKRFRLIALGILSLVPYLYALYLQDLRTHTVEFEFAFFAAFALYVLAVVIVLRDDSNTSPITGHLPLLFAFAVLFNAILVFTPPTLSDDMYRYVWDGRVQAHQINPYAYPPGAPQLEDLRDHTISVHINRPDVVTVYPAGAELVYAALWRIVPDSARWFQIVMAAGNILAGVLLLGLLRAFGRPPQWALIYLWNPLVIFETAHSAHIDGLVLPLLVAAWLARARGRDLWIGVFLGAATALKFYPALLLPALWRWRDDSGSLRAAWQTPLAFVTTFALTYIPYLAQGSGVVGFLPNYLNERFNMGLASLVTDLIERPPAPIFQTISQWVGGSATHAVNLLMFAALGIVALVFVLRPASDAEQAIRRSIWLIGAFTLLSQNLFPWYMLWLIPVLTLFLRPGRWGFAFDAWTGWFLYSGLVALAYTFFINWVPVVWAQWLEFIPLYIFLVGPFARDWLRRVPALYQLAHVRLERNA